MAHFAELDDDNVVLRVLAVPDEQEHRGQEYLADDMGLGGRWLQTSWNTYAGEHKKGGTPLRKNFAGVGSYYDEERDAFIYYKQLESYVLNEETCIFEPPKPYPTDGKLYVWNEDAVEWVVARFRT